MVSPFTFPVTAQTFNFVRDVFSSRNHILNFFCQAGVIFGAITIIAITTWYFTPPDRWLRQEHIREILATTEIQEEEHSVSH